MFSRLPDCLQSGQRIGLRYRQRHKPHRNLVPQGASLILSAHRDGGHGSEVQTINIKISLLNEKTTYCTGHSRQNYIIDASSHCVLDLFHLVQRCLEGAKEPIRPHLPVDRCTRSAGQPSRTQRVAGGSGSVRPFLDQASGIVRQLTYRTHSPQSPAGAPCSLANQQFCSGRHGPRNERFGCGDLISWG